MPKQDDLQDYATQIRLTTHERSSDPGARCSSRFRSIFQADRGIYGRFNPQALIACGIGIAVQIRFMNTPMYAGPVPKYLDGADLSWVIRLLPCVAGHRLPAQTGECQCHSASSSSLSLFRSRMTHCASAANFSSFIPGTRNSVNITSLPVPFAITRIGT